jgi:hypothetical protein
MSIGVIGHNCWPTTSRKVGTFSYQLIFRHRLAHPTLFSIEMYIHRRLSQWVLLFGPCTCQGETKRLHLRGPKTTQWQKATTCRFMIFNQSKSSEAKVLHMWRQWFLCSLGTFLDKFNGGSRHHPFWVIRKKQQMTCMGLIINFISLLFQGWRPCLVSYCF